MTDHLRAPAPRPHPAALWTALLSAALVLLSAEAAQASPTVSVSGSFYVDTWVIPDGAAVKATRGLTPDGSLKVGVDIDDDLSFSTKACLSCHGIELEHAAFDYQPKLWFNLQVGRLAVPFGEYSNRIDQSGHKPTSGPLIYDMGRSAYVDRANLNGPVVMLPYVDTGALAYGSSSSKTLSSSVRRLRGGGPQGRQRRDWMALRSVPYRQQRRAGLRWPVAMTFTPSWGAFHQPGRLLHRGGSTRPPGSGTTRCRGRRHPLWKPAGARALRRTRLDLTPRHAWDAVDPWFDKQGYAELSPLGRSSSVVARFDRLERLGVPVPGSSQALTPATRIDRATAGWVTSLGSSLYLKLSYEYWMPTAWPEFHSGHLGMGGAF
jgi:hypothetical protein